MALPSATVLCALLVAGPLIGLPLSFIVAPRRARRASPGSCPRRSRPRPCSSWASGAGTLVLGTALAALVSFFEFPGPPLDRVGARAAARDAGLRVHALRARARRARHPLDAAGRSASSRSCSTRTCTCSRAAAFLGPVAHAARGRARARALAPRGRSCAWACRSPGPAILGGVALALMEALADFGTVNLLGVQHVHGRDLPRLVQRLRPRRGDAARHAARRRSRSRCWCSSAWRAAARATPSSRRAATCVRPVRLRGLAAAAAVILPLALVGLVVGAPLAQLGVWSVRVDPGRAARARVRHRRAQQRAARAG